ncbi:MAG TPA: MmcQ/YjbR family DNA-binding protein [Sphingobacteriaceae bacterium]
MDIETLREYCIQKSGVVESFPFGEDTLVFKVGGKMFLLISLQDPSTFNAKCDPERAATLREEYDEITPGYHMSKVHWNTINMKGRLTINQLRELIDHSYELVYQKLPKKIKEELNQKS